MKKELSKVRFEDGKCFVELYNRTGDVVGETFIDDVDYNKIKNFRFHMSKKTNSVYVRNNRGEYLHNIITPNAPVGLEVDHINRNTLDNTRGNLRFATKQQQSMNRSKRKGRLSSKYKGVCWDKNRDRWRAKIKFNRVDIFIGRFDDEQAAAEAYNSKAAELFGDYAALNEIKGESKMKIAEKVLAGERDFITNLNEFQEFVVEVKRKLGDDIIIFTDRSKIKMGEFGEVSLIKAGRRKGHRVSQTTKDLISKARSHTKSSEETKARISKGMLKYRAGIREEQARYARTKMHKLSEQLKEVNKIINN